MKTKQAISLQGFTLIEFIITLAIIGILFSTALPSLSKMLADNQQTAQLHTLYHHHQLARSEAIKGNQRVLLCKSSDGLQCTNEAQWSEGWIIFSDSNNDNKINLNESVVYIHQALSGKLSLNYRGFGSHNYVRYYPDGHSSSNGTYTLCSQSDKSSAKSLIISRTGRARLSSTTSGGEALNCS